MDGSGPVKLLLSGNPFQVTVSKDGWSSPGDRTSVSVTFPHISLTTDTEEPKSPTEDSIRENLIKHREDILHYIDPSQCFGLLIELELDEIATSANITRRKQAEILLDAVLKEGVYKEFLRCLKEDREHLGHRYIASLLKGEESVHVEEMIQSIALENRIRRELSSVIQLLNVQELVPYLRRHELVTSEEQDQLLQDTDNTPQKRTQLLLTILKTKGPTAHFTFVHKCLALEESHLGHRELYQLLTEARRSRKRRASCSETSVSKRQPHLLEPPEGITSPAYIQMITKIREDTLKGGKMWGGVEDLVRREVDSPRNPLEMKIAILLESCNVCMLNRQLDEVRSRVSRAREMCTRLYGREKNAQVLEGRCDWALARLYKFTGDFETAKTHIDTAFTSIANCALGEEKILISFVNGSIILDSKTNSRKDLKRAINSFRFAISLASEEDFGMRMLQYCKIRLAQAYAGSSMDDPLVNREDVTQDNINEAKRVLQNMEHEEMHPRTRWSYMITRADVYRLDGQVEQALAYAEEGFAFARKNKLAHETSEPVLALYKEYKRKLLKVED